MAMGLLLLLCTVEARAQADHPASARLLADVSTIQPGEPFTLGIMLKLKPGWHVYWINPGDSGMPPKVKWLPPESFQISELTFPVPKRFDEAGGLVAYGYADEVLLTAKATPPGELKPGASISIGAEVSWLVCEKICLPGEAKLVLELPVAESALPANHELFDVWRSRAPKAPRDLGVALTSRKNWEQHELYFEIDWKGTVPKNIEWFAPPTDLVTFSDTRITNSGGRTKVVVKFSPLPRKPLPAVAMESVLAYDAADGTRQGIALPIDFRSDDRAGTSNP